METKQRKIKMVAYNNNSRQYEQVFPEDEVMTDQMVPMFLGQHDKYYTVPGLDAADVLDEWLAQEVTNPSTPASTRESHS
ncbi:MAG: hypothetical protein WC657_06060 [Candidatus Paceibacterota bacterium]|jgi:hypothetical protein